MSVTQFLFIQANRLEESFEQKRHFSELLIEAKELESSMILEILAMLHSMILLACGEFLVFSCFSDRFYWSRLGLRDVVRCDMKT